MKQARILGIVTIVIGLIITACGGGAPVPERQPGEGAPPAPEPTPPPEEISGNAIAPAFSLSDPDANGVITMNITGLATGVGAVQTALLANDPVEPEYIKVIEDGEEKQLTIERVGEDNTRADADIMFVLDTTLSMGPGLTSVVLSVSEFLTHLDTLGLNIAVGAITYGDAYDTKLASNSHGGESFMGAVPPGFDREERSSFALSTDFAAFREFLAGDITDDELGPGNWPRDGQARGNGRGGNDTPENTLGALEYAFDTAAFGWRKGAQKVFIVITDACSHNDVSFAQNPLFANAATWAPSSAEDVVERMQGRAVVHVVSPTDIGDYSCPEELTDMAMLTGSNGIGGVHVQWNKASDAPGDRPMFDLTELPLVDAIGEGYLVTFDGTLDGAEKTVELIIDDGETRRGLAVQQAVY